MSQAQDINQDLKEHAPTLYKALAPLGQRVFFPRGIPFQAGEAKGTAFNGTIGQFTDGAGCAVPLPSIAGGLNLDEDDMTKAFLYSPVSGQLELRQKWREWQRRGQPDDRPSTLPLVTCGLAHALSIAADLFTYEKHPVAILEPYWGNYRQVFTLRTGAPIRTAPAYRDGVFQPRAFEEALANEPEGRPAVAIVNFPSNPGGFSPTPEQRAALRDSLASIANARPLLVLCDDAYLGLVYDDTRPKASMFWDLVGVHPQLMPIKIDGATKEFGMFGGRVGFLTFGLDTNSKAVKALESKVMSLVRSTVGSPVSVGQMLLLQALRAGDVEAQVGEIHRVARERYDAIQPELQRLDPELLRCLPFNAGFFALLELTDKVGADAETVRRYLIETHDTGTIAIRPNYIRIATCSVAASDLPQMVRRIGRGVAEIAGSV